LRGYKVNDRGYIYVKVNSERGMKNSNNTLKKAERQANWKEGGEKQSG